MKKVMIVAIFMGLTNISWSDDLEVMKASSEINQMDTKVLTADSIKDTEIPEVPVPSIWKHPFPGDEIKEESILKADSKAGEFCHLYRDQKACMMFQCEWKHEGCEVGSETPSHVAQFCRLNRKPEGCRIQGCVWMPSRCQE